MLGSLCCGFDATVTAIAAPLATYPRPIWPVDRRWKFMVVVLDIPACRVENSG